MCDLGNNKASYSWWWDSHHSSHQSQWLQNTLSDLDEKTKAMLILIQEDGDSFAQRAEMFYKKRSELIKLVEEFHRSYRSLAEQYDQLRSESSQLVQSGSSSSSNSFKQVQNIHNSTKEAFRRSADSKSETPNSHPDSVVEDPDFECNNYYFGHESPNKIADELSPSSDGKCKVILNSEVVNKNINDLELGQEMVKNFPMGSHERETMWAELRVQVSTLMEDNLRQQAELIRRNNEKRDAIKDLCSQLDRLMDENRALHDCLRCSNVGKQNQSQISKLKGLVLGKFLV